MRMTEAEVVNIVTGAVNDTESSDTDEEVLKKKRIKMSLWLYSKFKIAISGVVVSMKDGLPYLRVEYENRRGNQKKAFVSLEKWAERIGEAMSSAPKLDLDKILEDSEPK
jgi:hypothetical protein